MNLTHALVVPATAFTNGLNVAINECGSYGAGLLYNASPCNNVPNAADFVVNVPTAGNYALSIEYAAETSRPIDVRVNGSIAISNALSATTGCWTLSCLQWVQVGTISLNAGDNTVRLERGSVFPHVKTLRIEPTISGSFVVAANNPSGTAFVNPLSATPTTCVLTAPGNWSSGAGWQTANGQPITCAAANVSCPMNSANHSSLVMRRANGQMEFIGESRMIQFVANESATFLFNDDVYYDNYGALTVSHVCSSSSSIPVAHFPLQTDARNLGTSGAGTASGAVQFVDGVARFSGGQISAAPPINRDTSFTVAAWVKPSSIATSGAHGIAWERLGAGGDACGGNSSGNYGLSIYLGRFAFETSTLNSAQQCSLVRIQAANAAQSGVWQHVAGVYQKTDGSMKLYVNGVEAGTGQANSSLRTVQGALLALGQNPGAPQAYSGDMSDVRVYDRALSVTEIADLAALTPATNPACAASTVSTVQLVDLSANMTQQMAAVFAGGGLRSTFNVICANGRFGVVRLPGVVSGNVAGIAYALVQSSCESKPVRRDASPAVSASAVGAIWATRTIQSALLADSVFGPLARWVCE